MIERALIIKKDYLDQILDNGKVWEMRSTMTNVRGVVGLIESGSGLIVGEVEITGCHKLTTYEMIDSYAKHKIKDSDIHLIRKWCYAWHLKGAKRYDNPIPYDHPQGAVIWVRV